MVLLLKVHKQQGFILSKELMNVT